MLTRVEIRALIILSAACFTVAPFGCESEHSSDGSVLQSGDSAAAVPLSETTYQIQVEAGTSDEDLTSIRACFDTYIEALLIEDGLRAAGCVDAQTLNHYDMLRALALTGHADVVHALPIYDKLIVLRARLLVPLEKLKAMTKQEVFAEIIENSWMDKGRLELCELGKIKVSGKSATGEHIYIRTPSGIQWPFKKESAGWKIKIAAFLSESAGKTIQKLADQSGKSEDDYVISMLELLSESKVDETIWQPLIGLHDGS